MEEAGPSTESAATDASPTDSKRKADVVCDIPLKKRRLTKPERKDLEEEEDMIANPEITIRNGMRFIKPYFFNYRSNAKGRWFNKHIGKIFEHEFHTADLNYVKAAFKMGRITCDGTVVGYDHQCKNGEYYVHRNHKHESPVLNRQIAVVLEDDDVLVVDKPPSIPIHPTGKYFHNSLTQMLRHELAYDRRHLRILFRIDRTTSGLMVFAKNIEFDRKMKEMIQNRTVCKQYLAMVAGEFPDCEMHCSQPIGTLSDKMGINCVLANGKSCYTSFTRVWTDGKRSVVRCFPKTGRTHQIRIHLQYLGYPIINDVFYNSDAFGPNRGSNAEFGKSLEQLVKDVLDTHSQYNWIGDRQTTRYLDFTRRLALIADGDRQETESAKASTTSDYDPICAHCHVETKEPSLSGHMEMYLHCLQYQFGDRTFVTEEPWWAVKPQLNSDSDVPPQREESAQIT